MRKRADAPRGAGLSLVVPAEPVTLSKLSVNVASDVAHRLREVAFEHRISESSIVEMALRDLLGRRSGSELTAFIREYGGILRRKRRA